MTKRADKPAWDKPAPKVRADAKLKNLSEEDQETLWLLLHPTDPETPPYTLEAALVYIQEEHDFSVSLSTLSEWRSWYQLKQRVDAARERAEQTRLELLKDPNLSPEDIEKVAQTVFTAEAVETMNVKAYVALAKLNIARNKQAIERDKLNAATKSKLETGLDALLAEIQGNPRALEIFKQLQEVVEAA